MQCSSLIVSSHVQTSNTSMWIYTGASQVNDYPFHKNVLFKINEQPGRRPAAGHGPSAIHRYAKSNIILNDKYQQHATSAPLMTLLSPTKSNIEEERHIATQGTTEFCNYREMSYELPPPVWRGSRMRHSPTQSCTLTDVDNHSAKA